MEERQIYRVNASEPVEVDVRVIVGTDTDLKTLTRRKKLIEGLHHRLRGSIITLPSLRARIEDVRLLASKFLWKASIELNRQVQELDEDTIDLLIHHSWPGNVRELINTIRRAVLSSQDGVIKPGQMKSAIEGTSERAPFSFLPNKTAIADGIRAETAPEALPEHEERYRQIVQLSPNGVFIYAHGRVEFANPGFARIVGAKSPEELHGTLPSIFSVTTIGYLMKDAFRKVTADRRKTFPMEQKMVRLDESVVDVETTAFPIPYDGHEAVMVVVEDITRRTKAEEALETQEKDLREKTESLEDANAALQALAAHRDQEEDAAEHDPCQHQGIGFPLSSKGAKRAPHREPDCLYGYDRVEPQPRRFTTHAQDEGRVLSSSPPRNRGRRHDQKRQDDQGDSGTVERLHGDHRRPQEQHQKETRLEQQEGQPSILPFLHLRRESVSP